MPQIECLVTLNNRLLLVEPDGVTAGLLSPIHAAVGQGDSPLEACIKEVLSHIGTRVSPSCAGVIYGEHDREHEYTLVFVADAPEASAGLDGLQWIELEGFRQRTDVSVLQRELIPLLLTADTPMAVLLNAAATDPASQIKETAPIPHARLSPLVFAVAS